MNVECPIRIWKLFLPDFVKRGREGAERVLHRRWRADMLAIHYIRNTDMTTSDIVT